VCAPGGRIVVSDFHPAASAAGHRRTFRDAAGARHEVEHHAHAVRAHRAAAAHAGLSVVGRRDGVVDDSIRDYYERAGLGERHERDRNLPLVLALALARAR
jgi:malonyl-CoA O-methyltransferase